MPNMCLLGDSKQGQDEGDRIGNGVQVMGDLGSSGPYRQAIKKQRGIRTLGRQGHMPLIFVVAL